MVKKFSHTKFIIMFGGDIMALSGVKCLVSNCSYWENGNHCDASAIEVNVEGGGREARQSDQTNCRTFKPSK
jgi:hypothetical protein